MTIHKAKGLSFSWWCWQIRAEVFRHLMSLCISSEHGVIVPKLDPPPMLYTLAKMANKDQDNCEELRLLYVALTQQKN